MAAGLCVSSLCCHFAVWIYFLLYVPFDAFCTFVYFVFVYLSILM